ncbi:hypothetical protein [Nonomuraea basaltis]|uniref:hypothetical protein n=1 Tax=Nonomuraea basaltis TaxID=2495887 RepID=UPI00110C4555|nr:hypothetical protein [Nonomuraea basaltis]TMR94923.1 hypothetical protein EJK15_31410 [Nonomuraea basaltis]
MSIPSPSEAQIVWEGVSESFLAKISGGLFGRTYRLSPDYLYICRGDSLANYEAIPLTFIRDVQLDPSANTQAAGDVVISVCRSDGMETIHLASIRDPAAARDRLKEAVRQAGQRRRRAGKRPPEDVLAEIWQLHALHKRGAVSPPEFAARMTVLFQQLL